MKLSVRKGIGFGLTSGIITTLGMLVGLNSSTHSKIVVLGGVLIVGLSDALSDAFGIHVSEEYSRKKRSDLWNSTIYTFLAKFLTALTFIIPILLFELTTAVIVSIIWGLLLIAWFSNKMAKERNSNRIHAITEHLSISILVILLTYGVGHLISLL